MRKTDKAELTYEKISEILSEDKPNQRPTYQISAEKISQLIPREYNDRQAEEYIIKINYYLMCKRNHNHTFDGWL